MKKVFVSTLVFLASLQALGAELRPDTIIGRYKVTAKAGFQKVYMNFRVIDTSEFELQRVHPGGRADEVCNGKYSMTSRLLFNVGTYAGSSGVFKGVFTCPSNRSRSIDFDINFRNKTTEDLSRGTSVTLTTSLAPGYVINAYVKKQ